MCIYIILYIYILYLMQIRTLCFGFFLDAKSCAVFLPYNDSQHPVLARNTNCAAISGIGLIANAKWTTTKIIRLRGCKGVALKALNPRPTTTLTGRTGELRSASARASPQPDRRLQVSNKIPLKTRIVLEPGPNPWDDISSFMVSGYQKKNPWQG